MKNNKTYNWKSLEAGIKADLKKEQENIILNDTPFYPLAFHAKMPEDVDFDNGHLSFRFKEFKLNGLQSLNVTSTSFKESKNQVHIQMRIDEMILKAKYEINGKYASQITMDTAGNMREFGEDYSREAGASDSGVEPLSSTEVDAMLTQARDQKTPIQATVHGPTLMSTYNEHSESYNSAFVVSDTLRKLWAAQGVTTQMSRDTHDALNNNTIVNSKTKLYANNLPFNNNAGTQQTNVAFALQVMSIQAKKEGNTALATKYSEAALAAASFNKTVNSLGSGDSGADPMTGEQVFSTLDDHNASHKKVSNSEFKNMIDQANDQDSKDGGADEEARNNGWRILRGEERALIRERLFLFEEEMMKIKGVKPELLWEGDCWAELGETEASVTLRYDEERAEWKTSESKITLPGFAIEIDDSFWKGKTADVVRERLTSIHFVKSLLQSKVKLTLEKLVQKSALQAITAI
ncbi:hypothetical protein [Aquimarina sediminis]|uniref:hypothetical protein n=1 Tax=Aquimarina sediminis TaxID=2070536 RepID=UPI000CA02783|nr:hypothetical protein [Aquimarina sediminis]